MFTFINGTDRTSSVVRNSIIILDELQERVNSAKLKVFDFTPTQYQEIRIFDGHEIDSATANSVTLKKTYKSNLDNNLFRVGDTVYIAINESDEESGTVSTLTDDGGNLKITFTANFGNIPAQGELCGKLKFAGNIIDIKDRNISKLPNLEYQIKCLDYTRVFDKKLLNDTYEDRDARYIVNDFCNVTVNKNQIIDDMEYANATAIRAEWIESGDGDNPNIDTTNFKEGDTAGTFPWTNSGGTATFSATPTSVDISSFTGIASGTPTKGVMALWYKPADSTKITSFDLHIGSDSSNYASITFTPTDNNFVFAHGNMKDASITGTPVWTAVDYTAIVITETASSNLIIDGIRILEEEFFRHYPYVEDSADFDDFRIPRIKPTEVLQRLSDELNWYWYIDYNRNIHLFPNIKQEAPFDLTETSDNFNNLQITEDVSRLINRQVVKGGDEVSEDKYSQVVEGDSIKREWILKNKFKNLEVEFDNNSVTDTMEAGTTTTTVKATGHGLAVGDYIVNRTRSNAVRKVLTSADANTFTVDAVTAQTNGDTFSTFVAQNVGVEGLDAEAGNDYMSNFNEKSIRSAEGEATISSGEFLMFRYNEVFPILVQRSENLSIVNMQTILGYSDGIFDGQPIVDRTVKTIAEARKVAEAQLNKYANAVITATFTTNQEGLETGQLIKITDTTSSARNIDQEFVIQKIQQSQIENGENFFKITASSLLFGMMEFLQQLLKSRRKLDVEEDARIDNIGDAFEIIEIADTASSAVDDNRQSEGIDIADVIDEETVFTPPFKWETTAASVTRWSLFSWS